MPADQLHVVFATDDAYAVGVAAAGNSARISLGGKSCDLTFHIIDAGLSPAGRGYLTDALSSAGRVAIHTVPDHLVLSTRRKWWTSAALGRLHLGDVVPDGVRRVIYLDADTLVLGDLTELQAMDLAGNGIGACINEVGPDRSMILGESASVLEHGARPPGYFNTGVLLVDMDLWRACRITEHAKEIFNRYGPDIRYVDQDVLNYLFSGRWTRLPGVWNKLVEHSVHGKFGNGRLDYLTRREGVVHFIGKEKPWRDDFPRNALRRLYAEYVAAGSLPAPPATAA
jgi:lipopolysaccharide biosynthesis glycosyltransferase